MDVFFYGLFMDKDILKKNGLHPTNPRKASLKNYTLKIGNRASLIPSKNDEAYGIVMTVDKDALGKLYNEPSVADYIPETVHVLTSNNEVIKAICYNLPLKLITGTNTSYALSLYELAKKLEFPDTYLEKIKSFYEF